MARIDQPASPRGGRAHRCGARHARLRAEQPWRARALPRCRHACGRILAGDQDGRGQGAALRAAGGRRGIRPVQGQLRRRRFRPVRGGGLRKDGRHFQPHLPRLAQLAAQGLRAAHHRRVAARHRCRPQQVGPDAERGDHPRLDRRPRGPRPLDQVRPHRPGGNGRGNLARHSGPQDVARRQDARQGRRARARRRPEGRRRRLCGGIRLRRQGRRRAAAMSSDSRYQGEKSMKAPLVALAAGAILGVFAQAQAADPGAAAGAKSAAVKLEPIPGSAAKRVRLSAKAAERLGIEMGKVEEQPIVRKQMVSGLVMTSQEVAAAPKLAFGGSGGGVFGAFAQTVAAKSGQPAAQAAPSKAPAAGEEAWIAVSLSPAEWDRLAKDKPARLFALATREQPATKLLAEPSGMAPAEDFKRTMLTTYYVVNGKDHGLAVNQRMRVELQLAGAEDSQKVVPYGALYYDARGAAWVYVSKEPLAFERQSVQVDRVVGNVAVLTEGPALGTSVVTVGAALLYGAEIFGK